MDYEKINEEYGCFTALCNIKEKESGDLFGIDISVKDCICVKGVESRAGSAVLNGYKPLFHATVVSKVLESGGRIIGKTAQDEFGFGSFCTNMGNGFTVPKNPLDKKNVCGGSSGGSGCITKLSGEKHVSLAESTGGSIACPAAFCSVYGLCPTYGRVSRYGLIDYGNSLDKIGVMATELRLCAKTLKVISGYDEKDSTSLNEPVDDYESYLGKGVRGMKIGIIRETLNDAVSKEVVDAFNKKVENLKEKGATISEVSLPLVNKYGLSTYYILALAEASTNLAKFCGMRYGVEDFPKEGFNEYFSKIRSDNIGVEAKRRIMLGTFARMSGFRDAYYLKCAKIRTMIIEEYKKIFADYDVLISPTMPILPPSIKEAEELEPIKIYMMDVLTIGPNLAGLPHISVPIDNKPIGFMIIGNHLEEGKILQVADEI